MTCRFAEHKANRIPEHWSIYATRGSPLHAGGRTPRKASDPINALLNYGYALAEIECRLAAITLGLDPGLGIVHTDQKNRDSLALDLLEPLRPVVERHTLRLLAARHFRANDFHETRDGNCRLLAPITHELAEQVPVYARALASHAETVAHLLARSRPGRIDLATPLSRANSSARQVRGQRTANRRRRPHPVNTHRVRPRDPTCLEADPISSNATTDANIRALPLYRLGWSDGHDLGLRQALDAITSERVRLEQVPTKGPHSPSSPLPRLCRRQATKRCADARRDVPFPSR